LYEFLSVGHALITCNEMYYEKKQETWKNYIIYFHN